MGTALARLAAGNGHPVGLWSIETNVLEEVRDHHRNSKYLPGLDLDPLIQPFWEMKTALAGAEIVIISVPSHVVRAVAHDASPHVTGGQIVLNVAKGLEEGSDLRMSDVLTQEIGEAAGHIASMGGPAIAAELARRTPTAVIVASERFTPAAAVQAALQNDHFKVETTTDVLGVEMAATLKNAYAIALGMCDGLELATNTKAFLVTLALAEMAELIAALRGDMRTAYGLAGLGDLLTTGYSPHGRNRTLGEKLCTDPDWREFVRTQTVEGIAACRAARDLARRHSLSTPLLDAVYDVLFEEQPPTEVMGLFLREFAYG